MAKVVISAGVEFDGEYELDDRAWNTREWRWIKQVSGYMPTTYEAGYEARDPDLFLAFAVIAMCRAGRIGRDEGVKVAEVLAEVPWDGASIQIVGEEAEPEDIPLGLMPRPGEQSRSESDERKPSSEQKPSGSGLTLSNGSGSQDVTPPRITVLKSATS